MSYKIKNKETQEIFDCGDYKPFFRSCIWECGAFRFTDIDGENFEIIYPKEPGITVSPIEFKLLFTSQERLAIKSAKTADEIIQDFFEIVDDPRLETVNLSLQSTQDGILYTLNVIKNAGLEIDVETRFSEILTGNFK